MPQLNPDKSYAQQPLRLEYATDVVIPTDWFAQLGEITAVTLELDNQKKTELNNRLNFHAGASSTYRLKVELLDSLEVIYAKIASAKISPDQKAGLAAKIEEGAANCTPGFHDRVNELVASFTTPRNLDEALQVQRQWLVVQAGAKATDEVHANNRFSIVACNLGYGVRPLNEADSYRGALLDEAIGEKLKEVFNTDYTLFHILNSLYEQIETIVRERGYAGRRDAGYAHEDYCKFDDEYLKDFITLDFRELFHLEEKDEDGNVLMEPRVLDINWVNVKNALFKKLKDERYFDFSEQENSLMASMFGDDLAFDQQAQEALSLFATADEFVQSLVFFKEWPIEKKVNLVAYYLKAKSLDEQKVVLKKLADISDLSTNLQSIKAYQPLYLSMAAERSDIEKVYALVQLGADVNSVLGLLFGKAKYETLWWLHQHPEVRAKITEVGMQSVIEEGKHQGKTVADVLISSKKGCQLLQEDERLQGFYPSPIQAKPISAYLSEQQKAIQINQKGFFKPFIHPKVKAFLQHVIRGEMKEAEKMLKDYQNNQTMRQALLTTKASVTDYAGRRIEGAALQLALGAKDVSIGEHKEMAEMLEHYLKELPEAQAEIEKQIAAQFPEGWEQQEEARKHADSAALKKVFARIGESKTDEEGENAVNKFKEYLARQKEKVVRAGFHFNDQLFAEALELYDRYYKQFGGFNSKKNNLAAIKVVGGIECLFTANLAQAACDGFGNVVEKKARLSRSLLLKDDPAYKFFHPNLGKSHFVYSCIRAARLRRRPAGCGVRWVLGDIDAFSELMSRKTSNLQKLMRPQQRQRQTPSWCAMM